MKSHVPQAKGWQFGRITEVPVAARAWAKKRCEWRCLQR
jgi:hypothetical protein